MVKNYEIFQRIVIETFEPKKQIKLANYEGEIIDLYSRIIAKEFPALKLTYSGEIESEGEKDYLYDLECLYSLFNAGNRPTGQYATSLSVGDVICLDGKYYVCKSFGFEEVQVIEVL